MRLDKFLKVSRLVKRRTLAKEVCDQGRVQVNGRPAKAGTNVSVGDQLTIRFGKKLLTVRVDSIAETSRKSEASQMYTIVSEETLSESSSGETEEVS
ncbi:RNA-binding S4 domain-containing protein [Polycladomyces subterraneus]|jgi:ribosomal 50S subunit-recycling heat shock protein|uniref:RQC P-site tRNA stabilizing factor n=1 Tax=Polycladomyces subterraneus TaxID=1016997 RepID=A0ABT8IL19_9BACL|nr:RNA-binding S4 domain-containing protein [Polycladomyces subterraneus]MDN4593482.1 RNA-binding S4 domain-containing protein [Polycladomyces subterraneus]